ncbi:YkgJ family cysteine cluster protein [Cyanobacterium sp. uoEpiScrs1]|uniref:YkgJ family cysteine cluster protein n=1 Tax=Cyanobacterium sp. uoEpiScrs1 TaxID=2976343 RepID=UPI00226A4A57|nr:YkgJ family cysteine cluster protein [Cyanobacterium sp. uoEpiScrs1]
MTIWQCVMGCGACCNLDPTDRPDLENYLTIEELTHYHNLVGKGGWCINFNHDTRKCRIYKERPNFCRVTPKIFEKMYKIKESEFNGFAIECCQQQIAGIYGENSLEMKHYNQEVIIDGKIKGE